MKLQTSNVVILALFLRNVCHCSILCSQCTKGANPKCETEPPAATRCFDPGQGVPQTCSIIRIYKGETKELIDFKRSCSTAREGGCFINSDGNSVCAEICTTDRCNGPNSAAPTSSSTQLLVTCLAVGLYCVIKK